jgi:hypothetical protein
LCHTHTQGAQVEVRRMENKAVHAHFFLLAFYCLLSYIDRMEDTIEDIVDIKRDESFNLGEIVNNFRLIEKL